MNDIVDTWQAMQDSDLEHKLFDHCIKARDALLIGIRELVRGKVDRAHVNKLHDAERDAFSKYLTHRTKAKPAQSA